MRHVQHEAARHRGLMRLKDPVAHRMMMVCAKDALTGLDPRANMDFLNNRPTQDDQTLFAFASYKEQDHRANGVHDQIARLVLMVVSPQLIEQLASPGYIASLAVRHAGYRSRRERLHDLAMEWQRLERLPPDELNPAADKIWQITVRTALR